jgi:hypothetical protein
LHEFTINVVYKINKNISTNKLNQFLPKNLFNYS